MHACAHAGAHGASLQQLRGGACDALQRADHVLQVTVDFTAAEAFQDCFRALGRMLYSAASHSNGTDCTSQQEWDLLRPFTSTTAPKCPCDSQQPAFHMSPEHSKTHQRLAECLLQCCAGHTLQHGRRVLHRVCGLVQEGRNHLLHAAVDSVADLVLHCLLQDAMEGRSARCMLVRHACGHQLMFTWAA